MLTTLQKERLINNLIKSCDDASLLTNTTIAWICDNWSLSPHDSKPRFANGKVSRFDKHKLDAIRKTFNVFEHLVDDVDLNYDLGWVNKWVSDFTKYSDESLARFYERCNITNEFRRRAKVKLFCIKYTKIDWRGCRKKYSYVVPERSMERAIKYWRRCFRISERPWDDKYDIRKVRQVSDDSLYRIGKDKVCPKVWDALSA